MTRLTPSISKSTPFVVGVFLLPPVQLLDMSPVDLFAMLDTSYLEACRLPAPLLKLGQTVKIHYIADQNPETLADLTANIKLRITDNLNSPEIQPGKLDVLLIPGPDPKITPSEAEKAFIRSHASTVNETTGRLTDIMTVCTGCFPAASAGIFDGKSATGPRALLSELRSKFPKVKWVEKRYIRDNNIWSSAGITNGQDLVAYYLRIQSQPQPQLQPLPSPISSPSSTSTSPTTSTHPPSHQRWSPELASLVCAMADVGDRGQEYPNSAMAENSWWVWLILRSWWNGGDVKR